MFKTFSIRTISLVVTGLLPVVGSAQSAWVATPASESGAPTTWAWIGGGAFGLALLGAGLWRTWRQKQAQDRQQRGQDEAMERLKKKLRAKTKEAKQFKTERMALIDLIARDLNAPLLRSETLLGMALEAGHLNDAQRQFLQLIRAANEQGSRLIRHITTIRQLETTTDEFPRAEADLAALLRTAVEQVQPAAAASHIDLTLDAPDEFLWATHAATVRAMVQPLLKLCIHSSPERSRVAVSLVPNGRKCQLRVKSEGPALTEEELEQMLHPFYQLGGTQPVTEHLSGIEIGVVKAYAQKIGALVDAESEAGKGTEFLVDFPA